MLTDKGLKVYMGMRGKQLIMTNDEALYKNAGKESKPSLLESSFAKEVQGQRFATVINTEAVFALPIVKLATGFLSPQIPRHGDRCREHLLPENEQRRQDGPLRAATEGPRDQCTETDCGPGEDTGQPINKEPTLMETIHLQHTLPQVFANRDAIVSDVWHRDLVFERGKRYLIEAASGTGKSSLCSYLYGYRNDYEGIICFDGQNIRSLKEADWTRLHRHSLSILFQELRLFSELTALENVLLKTA